MKLLITGSRVIPPTYTYSQFKTDLEKTLGTRRPDLLINGCAEGIDTWAIQWAEEQTPPIQIRKDPPKYRFDGDKQAPILRNMTMLKLATDVIAFWDGISPGTKHCRRHAIRQGKLRQTYYF